MSGFVSLVDAATGLANTSTNPVCVQLSDAAGNVPGLIGSGEGQNPPRLVPAWVENVIFNGTSWDRQRGNVETGALITHTAASAGVNGADQTNYNGRGVKVIIDVTAITGTSPTLTVTLQGKDPTSGKYFTILASAAISTVSTVVLTIFPGATASANVTANDVLPRTFRVISVIGGTTPAVTATVAAVVVV